MSGHVTLLLYEYASGGLPEADRRRAEEHLARCPACRGDLEAVRAVIDVIPRPDVPPAEERDGAFWASFAAGVEEGIRTEGSPTLVGRALEQVQSFVSTNSRSLLAGSGALALAALAAALLWPRQVPIAPAPGPADQRAVSLRFGPAAQRMDNYLRKSKILLVGLSNLKAKAEGGLDISAEQRESRALLHEARYLKQQGLDARSARLVGDLEPIFIELANAHETEGFPAIEVIRSGIRRENILFKIRMTETLLERGASERGDR